VKLVRGSTDLTVTYVNESGYLNFRVHQIQCNSIIALRNSSSPIVFIDLCIMSNGSPADFLLWAITSSLVSVLTSPWCSRALIAFFQFLIFLLSHLWNFDKFKCLNWNSGRQPGAFKRIMTVRLSKIPRKPLGTDLNPSTLT
jgi:hypothetical protein